MHPIWVRLPPCWVRLGGADKLASVLFGKAQQAVLGLLFGRPDESFYVREIVRATRVGQGAVQRELQQLAEAGIIDRVVRGRQVFYQANRGCPIFTELQGLVVKTAGVADVLRVALAPLVDRIVVAFVFGSFASGEPRKTSDVDVLVVGDATFGEIVSALSAAQESSFATSILRSIAWLSFGRSWRRVIIFLPVS